MDTHVQQEKFPEELRKYTIKSYGKSVNKAYSASYTHNQTLTGHTDLVTFVIMHPKTGHLFSASWDKTIRKWDTATGNCIQIYTGHTDKINYLDIHPITGKLYSVSDDTTIREWDTVTDECIRIFTGHKAPIFSLVLHPQMNLIYSKSIDDEVKKWYIETGNCIESVIVESDDKNQLLNLINKFMTYFEQYKKTLNGDEKKKWHKADGNCLAKLNNNYDWISCSKIHPATGHLYEINCCLHDYKLKKSNSSIQEFSKGDCLRTFENDNGFICLEIDPKTYYLYAASGNDILGWKPKFDYDTITFSQWYSFEHKNDASCIIF